MSNKIIVKQISEQEKDALDLNTWGFWEKGVSEFPWQYDSQETCYILKGRAEIKDLDTGDVVEIKAGDLVVFESGLKCQWDIKEAIEKYYKFD